MDSNSSISSTNQTLKPRLSNLLGLGGHGDKMNLRTVLVRATGGTFILSIISLGLRFVTGILLTRLLGVTQFGVYSYALSWLTVLTIPTLLGVDTLIVRELAAYQAKADWGRMRGLLRFSNLLSLVSSVPVMLLVFMFSGAIIGSGLPEGGIFSFLPRRLTTSHPVNSASLVTLWIALILLPLNSLTLVRSSAMRGLRHVVHGQIPDLIIRPLLFIILFGGSYLLLDRNTSSPLAMTGRALTGLIVLFYGTVIYLAALPKEIQQAKSEYDIAYWTKSMLPLFGLGIINVAHGKLDILMLGAINGVDDVALYTTALMLSQFVNLILSAAKTAIAPSYSSIYSVGNMTRLERVVVKSTGTIMLASLPIVIALIIFSNSLLSLFGAEFVQARPALLVLVIGQFINMAAGPIGLLLTMTNHASVVTYVKGFSAIVYAILNALLIPRWGMVGAAVATSISLALWNIILVWYVWRRLHIHASILGYMRFWRQNRSPS